MKPVRSGSLTNEPLPSVLYDLYRKRLSGVLRLDAAGDRKQIYVRQGYPVGVTASGAIDQLGRVLLESGMIDETTFRRVMTGAVEDGALFGRALIEAGAINVEQLREALKVQIRRRLFRLFFVDRGDFQILSGDHNVGVEAGEELRVQPRRAIYQGVRNAWTPARVRAAMAPIEGQAVSLQLESATLSRYGFTDDDALVAAALVGSQATPAELASVTQQPIDTVNAVICTLYYTDGLNLLPASASDAVAIGYTVASSGPRVVPAAAAEGEPVVAAPPPRSPPPIAPPPVPAVARRPSTGPQPAVASARSISGTHPAVPGGARPPSGAHAAVPPSQVARAASPPADAATVARISAPTDPPTSAPAASSRSAAAAPSARPTTGKQAAVGGTTRQSSGNVPAVTPDMAEMQRIIQAKLKSIDAHDLFAILDLKHDADKKAVKAAYLSHAKVFHPDRFASGRMTGFRGDVERIFRRLNEAYATLGDDQRRADYLAKKSQPKMSREEEQKARAIFDSEMLFMQGEVLFKKRDFAGALAQLKRACELNPDEGEYMALHAWARLSAKQASLAEIKPMLQKAILLAPKSGAAHYYLGVVYRDEEDFDRAIAELKRAVELNPRLTDAATELRLIQSRRDKQAQAPKGLFDRLRKK